MLVLSRKLNEAIVIDGNIRVTVVGIKGNQVRLGIEAPSHIGIYREELCSRERDTYVRDMAQEPASSAMPC